MGETLRVPLRTKIPTKGNPPTPWNLPLPYNFFEKTLPGISLGAFAFIERLQPYYGGDGPAQLRTLAILSTSINIATCMRPKGKLKFDSTLLLTGITPLILFAQKTAQRLKFPFPTA
jgi:hypothetical protein